MIYKVFSIYDNQVGFYRPPFLLSHQELALRAMDEAVHTPDSFIAKVPTAFDLFELGTFDDETGIFISQDHIKLCRASDFLKE